MIGKSYFSGIFGSSPIRPLQEHVTKVVQCAEQLRPLFEAAGREDFAAVGDVYTEIARLEDEADAMKQALRMDLPRTLFLPVDRRDLLDLLRLQDKIANKAKDVAGLVLGRRMTLPPAIVKPFMEFVDRSVDAARQAKKTVDELDELVETGFRGSEVEVVEALLEELDRVEKETDNLQIKLRALLLEQEQSLPPVHVMFLYRVIEQIGGLADLAERVGSRLQMTLAK
ncbi:TIGR00153 family protein [Methylonatrum kenyense]|uniref:TIGR00153 family protein n=1 Tax=Methylonatrum kenyense TaxID=455253 RepID=UPI0020C01254|nr:TIGR00153 family protein [Methylonatrum kenyense]MCK8516837.1 TIGR00153 family protein [Methylonatrum kenyense]